MTVCSSYDAAISCRLPICTVAASRIISLGRALNDVMQIVQHFLCVYTAVADEIRNNPFGPRLRFLGVM